MNSKTTTITPVLWSRKDKDKLHPIKIRFTEDRKSIYINVGWSISQKDWSNSKKRVKSTHKEHLEINYEIEKILKQYEKQIEKTGQVKRSKIMVFNFIKELIRRKTNENKFSTRKRYNTLYRHLMEFWGSETLYFYEIDEEFLYDFKSHLEKNINPNNDDGRPSSNTVVNYLGVFNSIINTSIHEGVFFGENPFTKIKIPQKTRSSLKTLSKDEIWLLDNLHPDNKGMTQMMWNSLNVFMFCFWSQGLRISDCLELQYGDFEDGFFHINMRKTGRKLKFPITDKNVVRIIPYIPEIPSFYDWNNNKFISTDLDKGTIDGDYIGFGRPIGNLTKEIEVLGGWDGFQKDSRKPENKKKFVFPYLRGLENDFTDKRWNKMSSSTSLVNKYLKKISENFDITNFSTHSSRHTFSSISKDLGVDIYDLKEWLGHTSVKITEGYISSIDTTRLEKHTNKIRDFLGEND